MKTTAGDHDRRALFALGELITNTRILADLLEDAAREMHEDLGLSVPERGMLLDLRKNGPMTVPALARHRQVSRQFVQVTVNPLLAEGLLAHRSNPAHRRSPLIALTAAGVALLKTVVHREGEFLQGLAQELPVDGLSEAADILAVVTSAMEARATSA